MRAIKYISTVLVILGVVMSCTELDQVGPDVNELYGDLKIESELTLSSDTVDFASGGEVYFSASFANDALWQLTIVNQVNGATWSTSGAGSVLSRENTLWNGQSQSLPWMVKGLCTVTLSFQADSTQNMTAELYLASDPVHYEDGVLVTDFSFAPIQPILSSAGWPSEWPQTTIFNNSFPRPDGSPYLYMEGNAWQGMPWGPDVFNTNPPFSPFVDILRIDASRTEGGHEKYFPLYADADRVYFNVMMYNTQTEYSRMRFVFYEDNDTKYFDVTPDWQGWKMVSINYPDLLSTTGASSDPTSVWQMELLLFNDAPQSLLDMSTTKSKVALDHMVFTFDSPLNDNLEVPVVVLE